jgi:hypothetical protein
VLRLAVAAALLAGDVASPGEPPASAPTIDVLLLALHGDAATVPAAELGVYPGRFVGRAVRTRGLLERGRSGQTAFELGVGEARLALRLEPQAAASAAENASFWLGKPVDVEGLFYRTSTGGYALRAWWLQPADSAATISALAQVPRVSLEDLVYAEGRFDGKPIRVGGVCRGPNAERDLPASSRKGSHDWVLKDGYFAVWITGIQAPAAERAGGDERAVQATDVALEVIGVPSTAQGVVRIAAREVATRWQGARPVVARALATGDSGWAAVPPRVSFVYPVEGERLGLRGQMIVQFNKAMDPSRFDSRVRVRLQQGDAALPSPRVKLDYSDPYRALVITPDPPPPAGCLVLVELLDGVIDVNGRALTPPEGPLRFRSAR